MHRSHIPFRVSHNRYSAKNNARAKNFICQAPQAKHVSLVGDFNDWDPQAHPLRQHADGAWHIQVQLNHGHHHYCFMVDGKRTLDPKAQGIARDLNGEKVSLLAVS